MNEVMEEELQKEDTQKGKYLTFLLGEEVYAIEIGLVTEIISIQRITDLPGLPGYVKGIVNIRGEIITVIDVRLRFNLPAVDYNHRTCIVIIRVRGISIGLIVDKVSEVLSIPDDNLKPPPEMIHNFKDMIVKAIGISSEGVSLILDCNKFLNGDDFETVRYAMN